MSNAEDFIRTHTALYRHYHINEVQRMVRQFTGESLSDEQAIAIVQRIRDERGMGPIAAYNLPGYVEEDDEHVYVEAAIVGQSDVHHHRRPWWKFW